RNVLQSVRHRARTGNVECGIGIFGRRKSCDLCDRRRDRRLGAVAVNSLVALAPTKELVSTKGMIGAGLNMRVGPMCRSVEDVAKILDVIAGYDPKDEMTVFSIGRKPVQSYASSAAAKRLDRVRIGVLREYMSKKLFGKADEESID